VAGLRDDNRHAGLARRRRPRRGSQLTTALSVMKDYGTVILAGSVSSYARPGDSDAGADLTDAVFKRITLRGYIVSDHYGGGRLDAIRAELGKLLHAGQVRAEVSEFDGLSAAPGALAEVFTRGTSHLGKRVVRIAR
jgi:NADPH-dependent curcumin reductase CurA